MSGIVPNTTQVPNIYFDDLLHFFDLGEIKTLMYAVRRTMGFHKQADRISVSQFMGGNGRVRKDGTPVERGTGLGKAAQIKSCKTLVEFGILIEVEDNDPAKNEGKLWALQLDESKINFDALWERANSRKKSAAKQTKKATKARAASTLNVPAKIAENPQYAGTLNDTPPSDPERTSESAGEGYVERTHRNKDRKPVRNTDRVREEKDPDESINIIWGMLLETCGEQEVAAAIWQLQEAFCESSGISRPDIDTEYGRSELQKQWWPVILAMYKAADGDLEAAKEGVTVAVGEMLAWKATAVSGPWSIKKKFTGALNAQRRAQQEPAQPQNNNSYQTQVPISALLG